MIKSEKCISPIEWDRNSEQNIMEDLDLERNNEVKEIQRICTQSSPQLDSNYRLPSKIKYIFQESRYFVIKSNNFENVSLAKVRNVWSTTRANEIRLNKAFYETRNVLLIFSVKESGKFQGYARLSTASNPKKHINWVLPSHMSQRQLSGVYQIDWLSRDEVPFSKTNHLVNAWNENKPVKIGRDGQEIEPSCGEFLCRLFPMDADCPFSEIIERAKLGPPQYRDNANRRHSGPIDQDYHYSNKMNSTMAATNGNGEQNYNSYRRSPEYRGPSSGSRSKRRDKEVSYPEHVRSTGDNFRPDNSDVFLNGNYEDYLREQTNINGIFNQFTYEQRVDEFLRNIVKREPAPIQRDDTSDYSDSSVSPRRRKRRRSRSHDRKSPRSSKYHSKRYRSRSRHRR